MDTFGSDSIFVKNVFMGGKISAVVYLQWINHSWFPSLCIGDNHGTVLESLINIECSVEYIACTTTNQV